MKGAGRWRRRWRGEGRQETEAVCSDGSFGWFVRMVRAAGSFGWFVRDGGASHLVAMVDLVDQGVEVDRRLPVHDPVRPVEPEVNHRRAPDEAEGLALPLVRCIGSDRRVPAEATALPPEHVARDGREVRPEEHVHRRERERIVIIRGAGMAGGYWSGEGAREGSERLWAGRAGRAGLCAGGETLQPMG